MRKIDPVVEEAVETLNMKDGPTRRRLRQHHPLTAGPGNGNPAPYGRHTRRGGHQILALAAKYRGWHRHALPVRHPVPLTHRLSPFQDRRPRISPADG